MKKSITSISAALIVNSVLVFGANAETVSVFAPSIGPLGTWYDSDTRFTGTAGIVDLSGESGNLKNNVPVGTGAAKLTTTLSTADKAQVTVNGNFGTMGDFILGDGSLSYEYFKQFVTDGSLSATAAIKLDVIDFNTTFTDLGEDRGTFVFEPYLNHPGDPTPGVWTKETLNANSIVWSTGIYDQINEAGGPGQTLVQWLSQFGSDFLDAIIVGISIGVGSNNPGQVAYFDDIQFSSANGGITAAYDFELAAVPVPAALPLFGAGIAFLGFMGWRKKRRQA